MTLYSDHTIDLGFVMNYLLLIFLTVFSVFLLLMLRSLYHQQRLRLSRKSWSFEDFESEYSQSDGMSKLAIQYAYDDLTKLVGYPVGRRDDLESTLGLLPEDFEDILEKRAQSLGIADVYNSYYAQLFPVKTVDDYVHFIDKILEERHVQ